MSDDTKQADDSKKKKSSKSKLFSSLLKNKIVLAVLAVGLLLILAGGYLYIRAALHSHETKEQHSAAINSPTHVVTLGIPPLISNLDSPDGQPVYAKITARVDLMGIPNEAAVQNRLPEIQNILQIYLHETRPQDMRGNGIYRLREAILRRLRADLAPLRVTNFYIVEFLLQ